MIHIKKIIKEFLKTNILCVLEEFQESLFLFLLLFEGDYC